MNRFEHCELSAIANFPSNRGLVARKMYLNTEHYYSNIAHNSRIRDCITILFLLPTNSCLNIHINIYLDDEMDFQDFVLAKNFRSSL